jgi:hypothetical protein
MWPNPQLESHKKAAAGKFPLGTALNCPKMNSVEIPKKETLNTNSKYILRELTFRGSYILSTQWTVRTEMFYLGMSTKGCRVYGRI